MKDNGNNRQCILSGPPQKQRAQSRGFTLIHIPRCSLTNVVILLGTVVFGAAGLAKVTVLLPLSRISSNPALSYPNPIFEFITNRVALALAAGLEIGVAVVALRSHSRRPCIALGFLAWAASLLAAYRLLLRATGVPATCGCLGIAGKLLYPRDGGDSLAELLLYTVLILTSAGLFRVLARGFAAAAVPRPAKGANPAGHTDTCTP